MKRFKLILCLLIVGFVINYFCTDVNGLSQGMLKARYKCDESTGWTYSIQDNHMESKKTSYYIYSEALRAKYKGYFENGIDLWEENIVVEYSPSGVGYISEVIDGTSDWIACVNTTGDSDGITQNWVLQINRDIFSQLTTHGKNTSMAHELGHVYGLGDLYEDSDMWKVMYYAYTPLKSVRNDDVKGMQVVTATHRHSGTYSKEYSLFSSKSHKTRCSVCKTYYIESHTSSAYCSECGYSK